MYISKDDLDIDLISLGKSTKGISIGEDIYKSTLSHPKTGVGLETRIYADGSQLEDSKIKVLVKNDRGFIEEEFYFDGLDGDKSFVDATNKFEEEIKKRLPEDEQETSQPETFKEMPKIGDIVRVGKEYGEVMAADEATRNIEITPLSKKDALEMLKEGGASQSSPTQGGGNDTNFTDEFFEKVDTDGLTGIDDLRSKMKDLFPDSDLIGKDAEITFDASDIGNYGLGKKGKIISSKVEPQAKRPENPSGRIYNIQYEDGTIGNWEEKDFKIIG
jgi:hypothetical protein